MFFEHWCGSFDDFDGAGLHKVAPFRWLWSYDPAESRFAMHHNILRSALNPAALENTTNG
jgi:hypothetical protein